LKKPKNYKLLEAYFYNTCIVKTGAHFILQISKEILSYGNYIWH